jgi:hypothetical protein
MNHYIHHIPGRLRVKTPLLKRNEAEAVRVRATLTGLDGLLSYEVNNLTGSLIVYYDPALTQGETILAFLGRHGFLGQETTIGLMQPGVKAIMPSLPTSAGTATLKTSEPIVVNFGASMGKAFGKAVFGLALEKLVERSAVALVSAIL